MMKLEKVTFYTVRWHDSAHSETDKFFVKFEKTEKEAVQVLSGLILDIIGTDHGAFFNRAEEGVTGLPPKGKVAIGELRVH